MHPLRNQNKSTLVKKVAWGLLLEIRPSIGRFMVNIQGPEIKDFLDVNKYSCVPNKRAA